MSALPDGFNRETHGVYYGCPEKEVIPCYLTVLGELPE